MPIVSHEDREMSDLIKHAEQTIFDYVKRMMKKDKRGINGGEFITNVVSTTMQFTSHLMFDVLANIKDIINSAESEQNEEDESTGGKLFSDDSVDHK